MKSLLIKLSLLAMLLAGAVCPFAPRLHAANPIQHIVWIIKENHSFDNYFGAYPGVNGAATGVANLGGGVTQTIPLNPFTDNPLDYRHDWTDAHTAYDGGAMDHFNVVACAQPPYTCYQQAQRSDLSN